MIVFVTVGTTKFDLLVQNILSEPVLHILRLKGYSSLVVQCGKSKLGTISETNWPIEKDGIRVEVWPFKASLHSEYSRADLVISHAGLSVFPAICQREYSYRNAGSGTILDVLRLGKPLIVVPNPTLLGNHQNEIASSLAALQHLKASAVW
jgi:beta-1,4-N-acetylglucosaminyltransferase